MSSASFREVKGATLTLPLITERLAGAKPNIERTSATVFYSAEQAGRVGQQADRQMAPTVGYEVSSRRTLSRAPSEVMMKHWMVLHAQLLPEVIDREGTGSPIQRLRTSGSGERHVNGMPTFHPVELAPGVSM